MSKLINKKGRSLEFQFIELIRKLSKSTEGCSKFLAPYLQYKDEKSGKRVWVFLFIGGGKTYHFNYHPLRGEFQQTRVTDRELKGEEIFTSLKYSLMSLKRLLVALDN